METTPQAEQQQEETIEQRVQRIIAEQVGVFVGDFDGDINLSEKMSFDSLDAVELVMALEDEFNIEIPDAEFEGKFKTSNEIAAYIKTKLEAGG